MQGNKGEERVAGRDMQLIAAFCLIFGAEPRIKCAEF